MQTITFFNFVNSVTSSGINLGKGRGHKTFIHFDPVIPLLGMQSQEIYSMGEISFMCRDIHCDIIHDRKKNGSVKEGELENYCTST